MCIINPSALTKKSSNERTGFVLWSFTVWAHFQDCRDGGRMYQMIRMSGFNVAFPEWQRQTNMYQ
jgi:hypothetical protein